MTRISGLIATGALALALMASLAVPAGAAEGQRLALLQAPPIQTPARSMITKVDYYVRTDHHGRRLYCQHRHCQHWHSRHDHHGNHIRYCSRWTYSGCYWVNPHHGH